MVRDPAAVHPDEDQERIAGLAILHKLAAVPVVGSDGRFLGVVPPQALIEILRREHVEDLHRLAGIQHADAQAREAIEGPPILRVRHRLPWLLVGLLGSVMAPFVVAHFERALEAHVAVAFFIPGIVYLADAIGTQTETVSVRGLSLSHAPFRHLLAGELGTGLLIGVSLGSLAFLGVLIATGGPGLAAASFRDI
jgi:magnesium transporter